MEEKVQYSLKTVLLQKTSNLGRKYLTWLKFSNLKRKTLDSSIPAAQQPDSSTPAAQQPDRNKISAILGPAGLTINAQLLPLACFSTMTLMWWWLWNNQYKRVPSQPRSPCELPPADHPHRPESHQQSRCPSQVFKRSTLPLILTEYLIWKNMRSPSKTQPTATYYG